MPSLAFASDNYAPAHPEVLAAIAAANHGYASAYGADDVTERLAERIEEIFGWGATSFPVLNGTGANVVSLMSAAPRWGGVITADVAHANTDEAGAPERVGGLKLLPSVTTGGKLTPADVTRWVENARDVHSAKPTVVSLTNATELGTVYRPEEVIELVDTAHDHGLLVHMDGARLMNAAAFLGTGLHQQTSDLGVDLISLGAAKNGGLLGELVVVTGTAETNVRAISEARRAAINAIPYLRKFTTQLAAKTRFISAQMLALLGEPATKDALGVPFEQRLWLRNARHANNQAQKLRAEIEALGPDTGIRFTQPTEANALFATMPRDLAEELRKSISFYDWGPGEPSDDGARARYLHIPAPGGQGLPLTPGERVEVRWMTSWATTDAEIDEFIAALTAATENRDEYHI